MPGRIVLYGATGYIGRLTARAMVAAGARPVLAGRNQDRLSAVAARLAQTGDGIELETAVAGIESPGPLRQLLGPGDVLVSTAGPFLKVGRPDRRGSLFIHRADACLGGGHGGRAGCAAGGRARPG